MTAQEAFGLVRLAGRHALPLSLAETIVANAILVAAGLSFNDAAVTTLAGQSRAGQGGATLAREGECWRLKDTLRRVRWTRTAITVAVLAPGEDGLCVASLPAGSFALSLGRNLADEPRDDMTFDAILPASAVGAAPAGWGAAYGERLGAALRAVAMAGSWRKE